MSDPAPKRRGRPPKHPDGLTARVEVRLTEAQRAKLDALGGVEWLRARIDRAKVPA